MDHALTDEGCPRVLADGRYRLGALLGAGGSGVVYQADGPSGPCAVKLRAVPDQPLKAARFLVESVPMSRVRHPRVVRVHDTGRAAVPGAVAPGEAHEFYWIAMDLCQRGTFADEVERQGPLPLHRALELTAQVLEALEHVHAAGFVHRDIKPQNLFLDEQGGAMVGDFGVARHLEGGLWFRTGTGQSIGTLGYRAPEQDMNAKSAGPAADVYGLAATLWFLLTARRPPLLYAAEARPDLLEPLPAAVRELVRDASIQDPARRLGSAPAMAERVLPLWSEARRAAGLPPLAPSAPAGWLGRMRAWLGG